MTEHSRQSMRPTPLVVVPRERTGRSRLGAPPTPPTRLLGREAEVARIVEVLTRRESQLLTLVGPGGVGKTRLAIQAYETAVAAFGDGGGFVALAAVNDPALLAPTVLQALGANDLSNQPPVERLIAVLAERSSLLVLDNLEQFGDHVGLVSDLLTACADLTILATSRTRLGLSGEVVMRVQPLGLPAAGAESVADIAASDAVRLFTARADAADAGFVLDERSAEPTAALCRRLDGLPLAIELAAVQVRILSPAAILDRIDRQLPLPVAAPRDVPDRQRSLEAVVAWSYDSLSSEEQRVLRRLSVFSGSFDLEAANAVAKGAEERQEDGKTGRREDISRPSHAAGWAAPAPCVDLLPVLAGLADKSLVVVEPGEDGPRFLLLETIRDFAGSRLGSEEAETARAAHAAWFLELAERLERRPRRRVRPDRPASDPRDLPNVRRALDHFAATGDGNSLVRMMGSLFWTSALRGNYLEERGWLERATAMGESAPLAGRAKVLSSMAGLAIQGGDVARAEVAVRAAMPLAEAAGDPTELGRAMMAAGLVALGRDEPVAAEAAFDHGLRWLDEAPPGVVSDMLRSTLLANAGVALLAQGRRAEAKARHEAALCLRREMEDWIGIQVSLGDLGDLARDAGDRAAALTFYRESLALADGVNDLRRLAFMNTLTGVACTLPPEADPAVAVRLMGAGEALRRRTGSAVPFAHELVHIVARRAQLLEMLGQQAFNDEWSAGEAMTPPDAIRLALNEPEPALAAGSERARSDPAVIASGCELTERERQVLSLLVAGCTDREIAEAISVSPRTAQGHVGHLMAKLGVQSRTGAVAAALNRGLVPPVSVDGQGEPADFA